jgi:hypothetical protein
MCLGTAQSLLLCGCYDGRCLSFKMRLPESDDLSADRLRTLSQVYRPQLESAQRDLLCVLQQSEQVQ